MQRLHVSIATRHIDDSVSFYTRLFGRAPDFVRDDYARWMLAEPAVNFSVRRSAVEQGVGHVGIQAETEAEWRALSARLADAGLQGADAGETSCCYARSDKAWFVDPDGVKWETFLTHELLDVDDERVAGDSQHLPAAACCAADRETAGRCCA